MNKYLLLLITLALFACKKEDQDDKVTQDILFQMMVSVPWQVNLFAQGEDIMTSEFNGYKFTFFTTNNVWASDGNITHSGTWYVEKNDKEDSQMGLTLNITFSNPETFANLSNDYDVLSANQNMITLRTPAGNIVDYLTLGAISESE